MYKCTTTYIENHLTLCDLSITLGLYYIVIATFSALRIKELPECFSTGATSLLCEFISGDHLSRPCSTLQDKSQ